MSVEPGPASQDLDQLDVGFGVLRVAQTFDCGESLAEPGTLESSYDVGERRIIGKPREAADRTRPQLWIARRDSLLQRRTRLHVAQVRKPAHCGLVHVETIALSF